MKLNFNPSKFITVHYQVVLLVVTTLLLIGSLYHPMNDFYPVAQEPHVITITDDMMKKWTTPPTIVKTGLTITDFSKFDTLKNDFIAHVIIWFEYDPKKISQAEIDTFSFVRAEILKKSAPFIKHEADGAVFVQYYLTVQFATILDYHRFPLDDHSLYLTLINPIEASKMLYSVDPADYRVVDSLDVTGWSIVNLSAKNGYEVDHLGKKYTAEYPKVVFSIDLSKHDERHLFMILLPLLFIFYFSMFALSIIDFMHAITVIVTTVSALIAYSFVLQSLSPDVGYFMVSDYFFLAFLFLIFIIFLIVLLTAPDHGHTKEKIKKIRGLATPLLYGALVLVWYYLTNVLYVG